MVLLHAGVNTGIVLLPIMPAVVGDTRPLIIAYLLQNIAAIVVVVFAGVNFSPEAGVAIGGQVTSIRQKARGGS